MMSCQELTITKQGKISPSNDSDSNVQGRASEAVEF